MDQVHRKKDVQKQKKKTKKKKKKKKSGPVFLDFVASSGPGCYIAHSGAARLPTWTGPLEPLELEAYGLTCAEDVPDLSLDPESGVLTALNASSVVKSYYLSTPHQCWEYSTGKAMERGTFVSAQGQEGLCTTLVVTLAPHSELPLCRVERPDDLYSHISECVTPLRDVPDEREPVLLDAFPLSGAGPFLCSQARGGGLSHFTQGTLHAIDLNTAVGTPVLAVGDGRVLEASDHHTCRGVHAENLFQWNSLLLELTSGVVVEYVHLREHSLRVKKGDIVAVGTVLAESGAVGFCPVPHLHFQCHLSAGADAPTVPFAFRGDDAPFTPQCGGYYSARGRHS